MRQRLTLKLVGLLLLVLLVVGGLRWLRHRPKHEHHETIPPVSCVVAALDHCYSTIFANTETPISEQRKWISGKAVGVDWADVATQSGFAYGTESGKGKGDMVYDDALALLTGVWGPDQTAVAAVHSVNQDTRVFEEVELRLRSSLSPHGSTGYEVLFRCLKTPEAYASIVRWDGPLAKFVYLSQKRGSQYGVSEGDVVKAKIVGNVITAYINGVELLRATDDTYSTGSPGMGFWLRQSGGLSSWLRVEANDNVSYGFSTFAAWDEPSKQERLQEGNLKERDGLV